MAHPFVLVRIDVEYRAHGVGIEIAFRPRIDERPGLMAERSPVEIPFDKVGLRERAQVFHHPADSRNEWVISSKGMICLKKIPNAMKLPARSAKRPRRTHAEPRQHKREKGDCATQPRLLPLARLPEMFALRPSAVCQRRALRHGVHRIAAKPWSSPSTCSVTFGWSSSPSCIAFCASLSTNPSSVGMCSMSGLAMAFASSSMSGTPTA